MSELDFPIIIPILATVYLLSIYLLLTLLQYLGGLRDQ